jgi:hypothetical protein
MILARDDVACENAIERMRERDALDPDGHDLRACEIRDDRLFGREETILGEAVESRTVRER